MIEFGTPAISLSPAVHGPASIRQAGNGPSTGTVFPPPVDTPPDTGPSLSAFGLQFRHDTGSGRVTVTVIDTETREIIRELPPEELLRVSKKLHDVMGILFDQDM